MGALRLRDHSFYLRGIPGLRFPIARSTCDSGPVAERWEWGDHGPRGYGSAATILLNHVGKDLREIQELLRHENIRTMVRYTHVGYEQTRQTAEALSQALE